MVSSRRLGTLVMVVSTMLIFTEAWSSDSASKQAVPGSSSGIEATVSKVDQTSVTLKPLSPDNGEINIARTDDGLLQVGDRVVLLGGQVKKLTDDPEQNTAPEVGKDGSLPGQVPVDTTVPPPKVP
jgi:preprotein translocase subunit YajC